MLEGDKQGYTTSPLTRITALLPHGSVKVGSGAIICRDGRCIGEGDTGETNTNVAGK